MDILILKINKPDEVIPFRELILQAPFFLAERPIMVGEMKATELISNELPIQTTIHKTSDIVICRDDLNEFINQLDKYVKYVQSNIDKRSVKNILLELATTQKGRDLLKDFVNNMSFNEKTHNIGNGELSYSDWVSY